MGDSLTIEAVLDGGLDALLNPAAARRKAGQWFPGHIVERLLDGASREARVNWARKLAADIWPALREERGDRWDLGWTELTAGLALAIELLVGELPAGLRDEIRGTSAEAAWCEARKPYQRFVLLVDASVHVERVFALPCAREPGKRVEASICWSVDGAPFRDRSHTLMLALLADDALSRVEAPVAATGELLAEGRVGPVGSLADKVKAWRQRCPNGLLIAAPPGDHDLQSWRDLVTYSAHSTAQDSFAWIVGTSMAEITAKLTTDHTPITGWDGSTIAAEAVIEPRLSWTGRSPRETVGGGSLFDACWAAWRDAERGGARRGVVVLGGPGSGKSVFSEILGQSFRVGPLGALGYGVRRGARELAEHLDLEDEKTWPRVLAAGEPARTDFFEELNDAGRLVPIIDGLDELQPDQLSAVSRWLQGGRGWWFATSRHVGGVGVALPVAWEIEIKDLQRDDASRLLTALGRADLAAMIWPSHSHASAPEVVQGLTRTPLQLALLVKVVPPGQEISRIDPHDLYERAFEGLIDHACRSRRLRKTDAVLVRRLLSSVVGELALVWLRSSSGVLSRADLDVAFDRVDMGPVEQVRAVEALVFGYLLVPAGAGWEFGHRTIAEWAAAAALHRRVKDAIRESAREGRGEGSRSERAAEELSVIAPFLEDGVLAHVSRWSMLLRFYSAYIEEPLALLDRLLGPRHVPTWMMPDDLGWRRDARLDPPRLRAATSSEILESWGFGFELMCGCRVWRSDDAQTAWGLGARRWLWSHFGERDRMSRSTTQGAFKAFTAQVGAHLPRSFEGLVALAGLDEDERARLAEEPIALLAAVPAIRAEVVAGLLERGDRRQQLAMLQWYDENGVEPSILIVEQIAHALPDEFANLGESRCEPGVSVPIWTANALDGDDFSVLERLEDAAWGVYARRGEEPPWSVVRRRFGAWPSHLSHALVQWFGAVSASTARAAVRDVDLRRRRDLLSSVFERSAREEREIADLLDAAADSTERCRVFGRVRFFFRDRDDRRRQRLIDGIGASRGCTPRKAWEPRRIDNEKAASAIRRHVVELARLRDRASRLVGALADRPSMDSVVGELWALMPPAHAVRREILIALEKSEVFPGQIPARELMGHLGLSCGRIPPVPWTPEHLEEIRDLTTRGVGQTRYDAILILAHTEDWDAISMLVHHLPSDDEAFSTLCYRHIGSRSRFEGDALPVVPDPTRLPLVDRAAANTPGWRAELLARLADEDAGDLAMLVGVVTQHRLREALPFLVRHLGGNEFSDRQIVKAVGLLASDDDERVARVALLHALRGSWPGQRETWQPYSGVDGNEDAQAGASLARFLRIDDLDALAEGTVCALEYRSLADAIRGMGWEATERLCGLYEESARPLEEALATIDSAGGSADLFPSPEPPELVVARSRRDAIAGTIVASLDTRKVTLEELVAILSRVAGPDVHHVYATPGPLGSDFDDPGDMDWHSDQENGGLIQVATQALEAVIARNPGDWRVVRQLFAHPSESLRKRAFEMCADRAEPHQVAELAAEALEGQVRWNHTRWTGRTTELFLAGFQSGAGTVAVDFPDTASSLVAAVRERLTPAHRDLVNDLTRHELPVFRALAARWAGELGDASWADVLLVLLDDPVPWVVGATVGALTSLAPARLESWLLESRAAAWSPEHDQALLAWLRPGRKSLGPYMGSGPYSPPILIEHLSESTLFIALSWAADHAVSEEARDVEGDVRCFHGYPSLVEQVLDAWNGPLSDDALDVFRGWLGHPGQPVRAVARRLLAARGGLAVDELVALLQTEDTAEQLSAAECIVRLGIEPQRDGALDVLRSELAGSTPRDGKRRRVLWALRGASPAFAAVLPLVAGDLYFDSADGSYGTEDEEVIQEVSSAIDRWGEEAVVVLEFLDQGEIDASHLFADRIKKIAVAHAKMMSAVCEAAARGGETSQDIVRELGQGAFERDLTGLAEKLADIIFPVEWQERLGRANQ